MASQPESPGCRSAAIATALLGGTAVVFMILGLVFVNDTACDGWCETFGLTLLYAGLPVSAAIGVGFGDLVLAWPLDITFWVVLGFLLARYSDNRGRAVLGVALLGILLALAYGLVLSWFVEIAI